MKKSTHAVFGGGISGLVASWLGCEALCVAISIVSGVLVNMAIDTFSHGIRRGRIVRGRVLHSLEGAVFFSLGVSIIFSSLLPLEYSLKLVYAFSLVVSGASHIILDSLTPGGVYVAGARVRLSWAMYDDPAYNMFFQVIGVVMIIVSLLSLS